MAANVFGFAERQGEGRVRAWHNLGYTQADPMTATESLEYAGINYRVAKFPVSAQIQTKRDGTMENVSLPNQFALIREKTKNDPEFRNFGIVSENYTPIQNRDIARIIDALPVSVETVGALGFGEKVFFALRVGTFDVAGDSIEEYFLVTEDKTGRGGLIFCYTPIRVVCQNTLTMGLNQATYKTSLTHSQTVKADANALAQVYASMQVKNKAGREAIQRLTQLRFGLTEAKKIIDSVYPEPKPSQLLQLSLDSGGEFKTESTQREEKTLEKELENVRIYRAKTEDLFEVFNDRFPHVAHTGYALYNAVTEHEDHIRKGALGANRAEAALFGGRAQIKARAFDLISQ